MIVNVREARPIISIGGKDYYASLERYLTSFSYTDNLGKADDLQLELIDPDRRFLFDSFPAKGGAEVDVRILCLDYRGPGDHLSFDCGLFEIDNPSYSFPPNQMSVKAISIPTPATIKGDNKTRAWEGKSLRGIFEEIATENAMTLTWDTKEGDARLKRIEQSDISDLEFIDSQAKEAGLMVKVKRKSVIVFSEKEYEEKPPAFVLRYGAKGILSGRFETKTADTAKEAEVSFTDPETGKVTKAKASDSDPKLKNARKIRSVDNPRQEPDLLADPRGRQWPSPGTLVDPPPLVNADFHQNEPDKNKGKGAGLQTKGTKKAKADLREANRHRDTASFEIVGYPLVAAGQTAQIEGFGQFDGLYFLEGVTHSIGPYRMTLNLHRELASKGY